MTDRYTDAQRDQLLGRIDGNVTQMIARQAEEIAERKLLGGRVSRLEQWRWTQSGAAAVIGAALASVFSKWPFSGH